MPTVRAFDGLLAAALLVTTGCHREGGPPGGRYDAGPILAETTTEVRHAFKVANTTDRPVKIVDVRASCSCTTSRLGKRDLRPGEVTELELAASVPKAYSKANLVCTLLTDHPTSREWVYSIQFESLPRVVVDPHHVDLGSFKEADLTGDRALAKVAGSRELTVDLFGPSREAADAGVSVEHDAGVSARLSPRAPARLVKDGLWHRRYALAVALDEGLDVGSGNQARSLTIMTADGAHASTMLTWQIEQPIAASPASLHFGVVRTGEAPARRLLLRSAAGKPFRVISVSGGDDVRIDEAVPKAAAEHHLLALRFSPAASSRSGTVSGVISVATDESRASIVRVPWTAVVGRPAPGDR